MVGATLDKLQKKFNERIKRKLNKGKVKLNIPHSGSSMGSLPALNHYKIRRQSSRRVGFMCGQVI